MSKEKRMLGNYEITQSIYIGDKEVVFGVDTKDPHPFMVCYCDYHNPLSAAWPTEGVASDDYLEAMQIFVDRVQSQIDRTKEELFKFPFDKTVLTEEHCIPDDGMRNIVGKVVVINSEPKRYEYQHPAYQLILADGGHGATGGRGQAVFGTCLATMNTIPKSAAICTTSASLPSVCRKTGRPMSRNLRNKRRRKHRSTRI